MATQAAAAWSCSLSLLQVHRQLGEKKSYSGQKNEKISSLILYSAVDPEFLIRIRHFKSFQIRQ